MSERQPIGDWGPLPADEHDGFAVDVIRKKDGKWFLATDTACKDGVPYWVIDGEWHPQAEFSVVAC